MTITRTAELESAMLDEPIRRPAPRRGARAGGEADYWDHLPAKERAFLRSRTTTSPTAWGIEDLAGHLGLSIDDTWERWHARQRLRASDRAGHAGVSSWAAYEAEWEADALSRLYPCSALDAIQAVGAELVEAERELASRVHDARQAGASWAEIGEALGMTRQAAHQRYAKAVR